MGNHYHLFVETPEGNLVEGMKWLQYTYHNLGSTQVIGGGLLNLNVGSQNTGSLLYTLGGQFQRRSDFPPGSSSSSPLAASPGSMMKSA
jgi:hypothetical protein